MNEYMDIPKGFAEIKEDDLQKMSVYADKELEDIYRKIML